MVSTNRETDNIMNITKASLKAFRSDFAEAVAELEKKHGVSINIGNITFDSDEFTTKMKVTNKGAEKDIARKKAIDTFNRHCYKFGLTPKDFGRTIEAFGETYTIAGVRPRAKAANALILEKDGKEFIGSVMWLVR